jgi:protein O-mannosyl-transferase
MDKHTDPPESSWSWGHPFVVALGGVVLLSFAVFSGTLGHGLLEFDDNTYVYENPLITPLGWHTIAKVFGSTYFRSYTPLTLLSHAVDLELWGMDPFGHHLTNVVLHAFNTGLMFLLAATLFGLRGLPPGAPYPGLLALLRRCRGGDQLAAPLLAALLFALHPLRVESVAWVSDRKDLLLGGFGLGALLSYILYNEGRGTPGSRKWYWSALLLSILAMLSKTVATVLPVLFLLIDFLPLRPGRVRAPWKNLILEKAPIFIASIATGLAAVSAVQGVLRHPVFFPTTPVERALRPAYTIGFYLAKTFWPFGLTPIYTRSSLAVQVIALIAVAGLTLWLIAGLRRRARGALLLSWCAYGLFVLPTVFGETTAGIQTWADRYSYLPGAVIALALGGLFMAFWPAQGTFARRRSVMAGGAITLVALLLALTLRQIPRWSNDEGLWRYAVSVDPGAVMAQTNLAMMLTKSNQSREAVDVSLTAIGIAPNYANAYGALGMAYDQLGDSLKAEEALRAAIRYDSNYIDAYSNLGNLFLERGRVGEAIRLYAEAVRRDSTFFTGYYNMGIALYRRGDSEGAMRMFEKTIAVNPLYPNTYSNMGIIYAERGERDAARASFEKAAGLGYRPARDLLDSEEWREDQKRSIPPGRD